MNAVSHDGHAINIQNPMSNHAALRSIIYSEFAAALEYPDELMVNRIHSGAIAKNLQVIETMFNRPMDDDLDWASLSDIGITQDALSIEYTRLFDSVGSTGPLCSLYTGEYTGSRMKTMEELVRFYNHFGLSMPESSGDLPDHVVTELQFLHYLSFHEAKALELGDSSLDFQLAQRDFICRHPGRWLSKLHQNMVANNAEPYFETLVKLVSIFLGAELKRLMTELGSAPETVTESM